MKPKKEIRVVKWAKPINHPVDADTLLTLAAINGTTVTHIDGKTIVMLKKDTRKTTGINSVIIECYGAGGSGGVKQK